MNKLKVLIACEESQIECTEFRKAGCEAYSCDIKDTSGNHPDWHIKDDVRNILEENWDLIIAHPPCTYLSNAGARWIYPDGKLDYSRYEKGIAARDFFMLFYNHDCKYIAIENPLPSKIFNLPKQTQIINPFQFGEIYRKKTYLWLKNLPCLLPTCIISNPINYINSSKYSYTKDPLYRGVTGKGDRSTLRSKSFKKVAEAMAAQWIDYIIRYG